MSASTTSLATKTMAPRLATALLLSALLWLAGFHGAEAGVNEWTPKGPEGWNISALAIDPQTPTTLYAGAWGGGVFKSIDGGDTWSALNGAGNALAIDPQTPTIVYAGTGAGVFAIQQQNRPLLAAAGPDVIVEAINPDGALVTP